VYQPSTPPLAPSDPLTERRIAVLLLLPLADALLEQSVLIGTGLKPVHLLPRDTPNGADEVGPVKVLEPLLRVIGVRPIPELLVRGVGIGVIPSGLRKMVSVERGTMSKKMYEMFAQVEGERRALTSLNGTTGTLPGRGTSRS